MLYEWTPQRDSWVENCPQQISLIFPLTSCFFHETDDLYKRIEPFFDICFSSLLKDICSTVSTADISVTVTRELHLELNELIHAILLKDGIALDGCYLMLFDTLLNILSMATDFDLSNQVNAILLIDGFISKCIVTFR